MICVRITLLIAVLLVTTVVRGGDLPEVSERPMSTSTSGNHSGSTATTQTPTQQTKLANDSKLLTQNTTTSTTSSTPSQFESVFTIYNYRDLKLEKDEAFFLLQTKRRENNIFLSYISARDETQHLLQSSLIGRMWRRTRREHHRTAPAA